MFSPEEDMLSCRRNFHFHWVPLLTGIARFRINLLSACSVKWFNDRNLEKGVLNEISNTSWNSFSLIASFICLCFYINRYEGLVLSVGGNGRSYVVILEAGPSSDMSQSKQYFARISTKAGFCRVYKASSVLLISLTPFPLFFWLKLWFLGQVRVPFSAFRPVNPEDPPLDPFLVHTLTIRFEPKRQVCLLFSKLQQLVLRIDLCDH